MLVRALQSVLMSNSGWGCLALALTSQAVATEVIAVPTGQVVTFHEFVQETSAYGLSYHFRFVAPAIETDEYDFVSVSGDMEALCNLYAMPRVSSIGPFPRQIVINLSSQITEFGDATPDITQYFEAYSIKDGRCMWEVF